MNPIIVTAAVIVKHNKVLIAQRKGGTHKEYMWEFPGGKLEENESPEECIVREIKEELGFDIRPIEIFDVVYHKYSAKTVLILAYRCEVIGGNAEAIDCHDFKWVGFDELDKFEFVEADVLIVEKLKRFLYK